MLLLKACFHQEDVLFHKSIFPLAIGCDDEGVRRQPNEGRVGCDSSVESVAHFAGYNIEASGANCCRN